MDIIAFDPYPKKELEDELGFMYVSLEDLLEQSDIISLHCPLTDENRYMLSENEFSKMNSTLLVNTARGELRKPSKYCYSLNLHININIPRKAVKAITGTVMYPKWKDKSTASHETEVTEQPADSNWSYL